MDNHKMEHFLGHSIKQSASHLMLYLHCHFWLSCSISAHFSFTNRHEIRT